MSRCFLVMRIPAVFLIIMIILQMSPAQAASLNSKCKSKGSFGFSGDQLLVCKSIKGNLLWQKATKSEKASYIAKLNQKIAASRQTELNDLFQAPEATNLKSLLLYLQFGEASKFKSGEKCFLISNQK